MKSIRVPEELERALRASKRAARAFAAMPPSHRRRYGEWVFEAKKPETRERRAAQAIEMIETWGAARKEKKSR